MKKWIFYICLLALLSGCSGKFSPERRAIRLSANVSGVDVQTKAHYDGGSFGNENITVQAWFSSTPGKYPDVPTGDENLPNRVVTTLSPDVAVDVRDEGGKLLQYPVAGASADVYCVGFYPSDGWTIADENANQYVVSHPIDGDKDLMFADQIKGSYTENFGDFRFGHLLTWVAFNVSATSSDAAAIWGNVTNVSIVSPLSNVKITLSTGDVPSTVAYDGDPSTVVVNNTSSPLSIKATDVGDALISYPSTKNDAGIYGYNVSVTTSGVGEKSIFVPLYTKDIVPIKQEKDAKAAIGKQYVISLYFNEVSVVSGVCTLKYWEDVSEELYVKKEGQSS